MNPAVIAAALLPVLLTSARPARDIYVSPKGSDRSPGTKEKPLATLEAARDAARKIKSKNGVTVWVRGGTYFRDRTFELGPQDSGVTYRAFPNEQVRITGGREINGFKPVTDLAILGRLDEAARGKVLQADLKAQGITDFGELTPRGFGRSIQPAALETLLRQ